MKIDISKRLFSILGGYLVSKLIRNMDKISYGRRVFIYDPRSRRKRWHIVSRRGDPPNNFTMDLKKTIRFQAMGDVLYVGMGNRIVDYAKDLESPIFNRLNLTTIIEKEQVAIQKIIDKEFQNYVNENIRQILLVKNKG